MLSLFPQLLFLSPFAPLLIRVAVGLSLLYIANRLIDDRKRVSHGPLPVIGSMPIWLTVTLAIIAGAIGIMAIVGIYTQVVGILAAIIALKQTIFSSRYPVVVPLSRAANLMLLAMSLTLVVTGAGAFAFDLPL